MPYITKERKNTIAWDKNCIDSPGELNYIFTLFINRYIEKKKLSYHTINDIIGALEGAKLEFYRRIAVPYEDKKIQENGDVY